MRAVDVARCPRCHEPAEVSPCALGHVVACWRPGCEDVAWVASSCLVDAIETWNRRAVVAFLEHASACLCRRAGRAN